MKILVFILALSVLTCSMIPCRELAVTANGHEQSTLLKSSAQPEHNDSNDNCSPFCSCNCCCGITFLFTSYQVVDPIAVISKMIVFHLPREISDASLPVWQPPQLA